MRKIRLAALLMAAMMLLCVTASAAARMPEMRGALTDDADVLGAQTARDIVEYAEMAEDETDVNIHVAIVHFLDGLDSQTYADQLFQKWGLEDEDLLILGAAGEDSFAVSMGDEVREKLGKRNAENLLYTSSSFKELFQTQQYDAAFASLFTALNTLLNKQYHTDMELDRMFAAAQAPASQARDERDFASELWDKVLGSIDEHTQDIQETRQYENRRENNGIGVGGWVVMAIIIMIIFGQSDPVRRARNSGRSHYRDYGCGCSPLGWILAMIGAGAIIDKLRGRR